MEKKKNKFLRNKVFVIFGILAILICLVAVFAPQICGDVDPAAGNLAEAIMEPGAGHPFGTDKMGRDIFTRVLYGARTSLSSTFILVAVIFVVGSLLGVLAGLSCYLLLPLFPSVSAVFASRQEALSRSLVLTALLLSSALSLAFIGVLSLMMAQRKKG